MDTLNKKSSVSDVSDLTWRALQLADVDAIASLVDLCLELEAGYEHGLSSWANDTEAFIRENYLPTVSGVSTGTFDTDGRLLAFASVDPLDTAEEHRVTIVGHVHPDFRRRGIGTHLLTWSAKEASALLESCPSDRPHVLQISTESLTETATHLFEQHGFDQRFAEDVMRRDLRIPISEARFPKGVRTETWAPALVDQFYSVYRGAYQTRSGFVPRSQDEWTAWMDTDGEGFRSQQSLIAFDDKRPVGFICCDDEWVMQLGVLPEWRRRGIGSALVNEALIRFRAAGTDSVMLHVNVNNTIACQMYNRCGFEVVGRRARYVRVVK